MTIARQSQKTTTPGPLAPNHSCISDRVSAVPEAVSSTPSTMNLNGQGFSRLKPMETIVRRTPPSVAQRKGRK